MVGHSWDKNADFSIEISLDKSGGVKDETNEKFVHQLRPLAPYLAKVRSPDHWAELVIEFRSSGSYSPQTHWEPEDHSEDREFVRAYILDSVRKPDVEERHGGWDNKEIPLPPELGYRLFDAYIDQINDTELPEDDEPDYDDREPDYDDRDPWEQVQRVADFITEDPNIFNE